MFLTNLYFLFKATNQNIYHKLISQFTVYGALFSCPVYLDCFTASQLFVFSKKSILCTCQVLLLLTCFESCDFSPHFFPPPLTCVFGEADAEWRLLDLLCEQILLVEEEDNGGVDEELVVTDGVKEHERLMHAVLQEQKICDKQ